LITSEWVNRFNIVYQQFRAMYDGGCQNCCNWFRLRPAHQSTMPQINTIPHPVTLKWHRANQNKLMTYVYPPKHKIIPVPWSIFSIPSANQGSTRHQVSCIRRDPDKISNTLSTELWMGILFTCTTWFLFIHDFFLAMHACYLKY